MYKIDLHVHSNKSFDSNIKLHLAIKISRKKNLNGIGIVNHGDLFIITKKFKDFFILSGSEILTHEGEIIAFGIQEKIKPNLLLSEVLDKIHEQGGIGIACHPFDCLRKGLQKIPKKIDAIETINSRYIFNFFSKKADTEANNLKLPKVGGSDAHLLQEIGNAYTCFTSEINSEDDILRLIKKGMCYPEGNPSSVLFHAKSYVVRVEKILKL